MTDVYIFPAHELGTEWPKCPPELVEITESPYISGTAAKAYFGPVKAEGFTRYRSRRMNLERIVTTYLPLIQALASDLGANVVVGFDLTFDPYAERDGDLGVHWVAVGTAARLEPLY